MNGFVTTPRQSSQPPQRPTRNTPVNLPDLVRRLDWRFELLAIMLVLAEAALVYLALGLLLPGAAPRYAMLPAWIVLMLLLVAYATPHLMDEWRVWSPHYEAILGTAIALSTLAAVKAASFPDMALWNTAWIGGALRSLVFLPNDATRPVWGIVVLAAYAWWRGRTRAEPSLDSAYAMLRVGSLALGIELILVLSAAPDGAQVRDRLSLATLVFYLCTLGAIGVARLKLEGFRTSAALGPRWLATFVAPILAVAVVAVLAAGIFSRQFLDTALWLLSPVFWFLAIAVQIFVLLLAIIAFVIITPILWAIGTREPRQLQTTPQAPNANPFEQLQRDAQNAINVPDPLRYLIVAIVLFAIFSVLTRFVFRRRRRERETTEEVRESTLDWSDLFGSLAGSLKGILRRPRPDDPLRHLRDDPRWRHTLAIRETYVRLQERGAQAGRPRRRGETADEYRPNVAGRLATPEAPPAVATITDIYRQARYSGTPAEESAARDAAEAWARVDKPPADAAR